MNENTHQPPIVHPGDQVLQSKKSPRPRLGFEHLPKPGGLIAGGLVGLYALKRRGLAGLFAAGVSAGLLYRSAHYNGLTNGGWLRRLMHTGATEMVPFEHRMLIDRPPEQVYQFWRNAENIAVYLPRVRNVEYLQPSLTRWQLKLTDALRVQWTAELMEDRPGELLVWRTRNPSDLEHEGWVEFEPRRDGKSTQMTVRLYLLAPGGKPGAQALEKLRRGPIQFFSDDLQRVRQVLESDEFEAAVPE